MTYCSNEENKPPQFFCYMVKHELRVKNHWLSAESLKAQVEIQRCELKGTRYKFNPRFKSWNPRVKSLNLLVASLNLRVTSSNPRVTSSNLRVPE